MIRPGALLLALALLAYFIIQTVNVDIEPAFSSPFSAITADTSTQSQPVPAHAVILLYHHVADNTPALTSISPTLFEQHLQYLSNHDFKVWPLHRIIDAISQHQQIPDKVVAITFDDGYQSIYQNAFPLLKKHHFPFTIFVSTAAIDQRFSLQSSWDELRTMAAAGATIGNHSNSHDHLLKPHHNENSAQWLQRIKSDISKAELRIQQEIGISRKFFAYPYGEYNQQLSKLILQLGLVGFGQHSGAVGYTTEFSAIPRFPVAGNYASIEDFALKTMTLPLPVTSTSATAKPLRHNQSKPELTLEFSDKFTAQETLQCFDSYQQKLVLKWVNKHRVEIHPTRDIPTGRSRYNCTASFNGTSRFYWYSYPWIRLDRNDKWAAE